MTETEKTQGNDENTKEINKDVELSEKETEEEASFSDDEDTEEEDNRDREQKKKKIRKRIIFGGVAGVILLLIIASVVSGIIKKNNGKKNMYADAEVERRTIKTTITGSSSTKPNDSYDVTTIQSGDIINDYFKEGDTVKKGDKLYQIDDEKARNSLKTAQNALTKADQDYVDAVKKKSQTVSANEKTTQTAQNAILKALNNLTDSQTSYDYQTIRSDISGKVADVKIKENDFVGSPTVVASIYDDRYLKLRVPFNDTDAEGIKAGDAAAVTVTASGDELYGTVTEKAGAAVATSSRAMVVYVTIEVTNPGALTDSDRGSAVVGGIASADTVNFEYIDTQDIVSKGVTGTVKSLSVAKGDYVRVGDQVAYIKVDTSDTALSNSRINYNDALLALEKQVLQNDTYAEDSSIKAARLNLDDAKTKLGEAEKAVKDYAVEAPIEGTVVKKNVKSGDTIDAANKSQPLCVIYDLSSLKVTLDVDETEIEKVKVGQKAKITADAAEGEYEGYVTKVPVDGKNENGVTTYTVEIQVKDYGKLLPGMNVDVEIIVDQAENVLSVPLNSVNRGNIVYVKDDGKQRSGDVTDELKKRIEANDSKKKNGGEGYEESVSIKDIPQNTEVPEGYRVIKVETGLNDSNNIEIKNGLTEGDKVRTINTDNPKSGEVGDEDLNAQMEQQQKERMHQMQTGGGVSGGMGGPPAGAGQ